MMSSKSRWPIAVVVTKVQGKPRRQVVVVVGTYKRFIFMKIGLFDDKVNNFVEKESAMIF